MDRLEEIKGYYYGIYEEDIQWLIQQVEEKIELIECVKELEKENKRLYGIITRASKRNINFIEENRSLKQTIDEIRIAIESNAIMILTYKEEFKRIHEVLAEHYNSKGGLEVSKINCKSCKGEISWKEPMIVYQNKTYCEVCYEEVKEANK